jgi:hypothetical protein
MSKMALHESFGYLQHKLWSKEGPGVKLAIWLPTTKNQESTWPWCVQAKCNRPLESSQRELQVCFGPHPNQRSEWGVKSCQSPGSLNPRQFQNSFGTPTWESRDKQPFGCGPRGVAQNILYGERWWLPPSPGRGESSESRVTRGLS